MEEENQVTLKPSTDIKERCRIIKERVDIVEFIGAYVELKQKGGYYMGLCPFHEEKTPSFSVNFKTQWYHCYGGCGAKGDVIDFVAQRHGIRKIEAINFLENHKHITPEGLPDVKQRRTNPDEIFPALDWQGLVDSVYPFHVKQLADWRGYSLAFCQWLHREKYIGIYNGCFCFPICNKGVIVRAHVRMKTSPGWFYHPKEIQCPTDAMIIGDGSTAHFFESQWDMFAVMDKARQHARLTEAWIATRGASNAGKLTPLIGKYTRNFLYPQRDGGAGESWKDDVALQLGDATIARTPGKAKDANEYFQKHAGKIEQLNPYFKKS